MGKGRIPHTQADMVDIFGQSLAVGDKVMATIGTYLVPAIVVKLGRQRVTLTHGLRGWGPFCMMEREYTSAVYPSKVVLYDWTKYYKEK